MRGRSSRDELKSVRRTSTASTSEFVDSDKSAKASGSERWYLLQDVASPNQCRELLAAVRNEQRRNVSGRRSIAVFHAASPNHRDLAKPDREAKRCPGTNAGACCTRRSRPSRAGAAGATSAGRRRASAGRAADRDRSICNGHRGAERGNSPRGHCPAWRSPVFQARHYRLHLCAGRREPADHPGSRRQSRRHPRKWCQRWRRLRSRRRPFRAGRSTGDKPGRSHPWSGGDAVRIDIDRRRRKRNQQSHPGRLAFMRGRTVPDLRPAGEGAARDCTVAVLRNG